MTDVTMTSELKAQLIQSNGSDDFVIHTARVSAAKEFPEDGRFVLPDIPEKTNKQRFINALMEHRHGVPFEHNVFTFFVEAPIFVARQWVKHRISSMNEMSGRYTQMLPKFYTAPSERKMLNIGTKMRPNFVEAPDDLMFYLRTSDIVASEEAWNAYEERLERGAPEEYARIILPLNTYTQFYWSINGRSLMNFLERRVDSPDNRVATHPQWEIETMARHIEEAFAQQMPLTHHAFVEFGRVAP